MKKFLELISEEMGKAFEAAGYQADLGKVTISGEYGFFGNKRCCAGISEPQSDGEVR